jgi:tetratricopeptide (TPR) repeat protein
LPRDTESQPPGYLRDNGDQVQSLYEQALDAVCAKDFPLARHLLDRVIARDPNHVDAYYKRGNVLKNLGQLQEAIASYGEAIARKPDYTYAYCNRGVLLQALGRNTEALASYDLAIVHDPRDALTHYNRALLLQELSRWDEAIAGYEHALAIDPAYADAHYNRSLALLYCGRLEQGWRSYEWRWKNARRLGMGETRDFRQQLWLGDDSIDGMRLLLHCEGGLGDTLQFSRYAALAAACGALVYLEIQPPLAKLLAKVEGVSGVFIKGNSLPAFDYHCPMMSLPLAFRTTFETIPPPAGPLQIDETKQARWTSIKAQKGRPRVGLVWSGNPNNQNDQRRSIRLRDWLPALPREYQYFRLQRDVRDEDRPALTSACINSVDEDVQDFSHIAALCQCMDLIISVDTSIAHLSATLAIPTWVLLPFIADWRWLRDRVDSPWYPAMKLFRQKSSGNWSEVFKAVASDLRREYPAD